MKLSFNQHLIGREVDQCFFDHDAFIAFFSNEVGYKLLSLIRRLGTVDSDWLIGLANEPKKMQAISSFVNICIEKRILIESVAIKHN